MNTLSLGATFGALVWIFQDGPARPGNHDPARGKTNWWAPPVLRRIHSRFGLSETPNHAPDPATQNPAIVPARAGA